MNAASCRACVLVILTASLAYAGQQRKVSAVQEADIRQLLQLTGTTDAVAGQMGQMAEQLKPLVENSLPPGERRHEIAEAFTKRFRARANSEALTKLMIPIYAKYLTDDDVKSLIRFYESPAGQRLLKVMPQMMKESGEAGREWGTNLATEIVEEMAKEYPELRQKP
jgi:uncharacterized protein